MHLFSSIDPGAIEADDLERLAPVLFALLTASPDFVVLISPEGVIRFINRVYAGLTMAEVSGRSIFEFLDPGYHEVARACYRDVATTGQAGHYETLGLGSNGEKARYESHVAPVKRGAEVIALTIIARDITLRVELERQLRASRKQLEVAIAASGLGLWSWDPRTDAIEVDAGVLQIHRRSRAEAPATLEALLQCAHPDDHSFVDAGFRRAPMTGEFPDLEYRIVRKDRTIAWVLVKGRVTRDDGDRIVGLLGGAIDVTEQRQAAAALRVSEQRYRSLIAVLDEGILVQDADRTIHTLNASARRILGLSESQVAGLAPLHPRWRAVQADGTPFRDQANCPIFTLHTGEPEAGAIVGLHKPEGQLTWVSIVSQPLPELGPGQPRSVVSSFVDITARKTAELEKDRVLHQERAARQRAVLLAETSKLLASTLDIMRSLAAVVARMVPEHLDLAIFELLDDAGELGTTHRVIVASDDPALAERFLELRSRRAVDETIPLMDTLRRRETRLFAARPDGVPAPLVAIPDDEPLADRMRYRATALVPLLARTRPLGVLIVGSRAHAFHPDEVELAEELALRTAQAIDIAHLYAEMEAALARREEFIAIAAHELRTPLTPILMQCDRLLRLARSDAQLTRTTVVPKLEVVHRQVTRLHRLIEEMLDVSNITSGHLELALELVDFVAVVHDTITRFADELERAGCEVKLDLPASLMGRWDRTRLEQIIGNILSNAMKYGEHTPIELTLTADDKAAELAIRDHGIGISAQDQQRIFQRFERAVPERQYSGLGLGLWVARSMTEAMGGHVRVISEPGVGSTFFVSLPRAR
jgi:PAS domain S-box-containing protein